MWTGIVNIIQTLHNTPEYDANTTFSPTPMAGVLQSTAILYYPLPTETSSTCNPLHNGLACNGHERGLEHLFNPPSFQLQPPPPAAHCCTMAVKHEAGPCSPSTWGGRGIFKIGWKSGWKGGWEAISAGCKLVGGPWGQTKAADRRTDTPRGGRWGGGGGGCKCESASQGSRGSVQFRSPSPTAWAGGQQKKLGLGAFLNLAFHFEHFECTYTSGVKSPFPIHHK